MIVSPSELADKARELTDCSVNKFKLSVTDILKEFGFSQENIDLVTGAIDSVPVEQAPIVSQLGMSVDEIPTQLEPVAQTEVNAEKQASMPAKPSSSVNGYQSDSVIEPINISRVSTPKNIPNNNNSFEEDHPNTFGHKDRAGNFAKHNLLTGLYQQGLKNGYIFRSDQNGNTTIYIPGNHKLNVNETMNINSGSADWIVNGEYHLEASKKITIIS